MRIFPPGAGWFWARGGGRGFWGGWLGMALMAWGAAGAGERNWAASWESNAVVVVYNSRLPESKAVAEYYGRQRGISGLRIFGFDLPATETMTREEFRTGLQEPLFQRLRRDGLFEFESQGMAEKGGGESPSAARRLSGSKIRYATLCYGVPVRILGDSRMEEEGAAGIRIELRRNEAAVDSELALLPLLEGKPRLYGPLRNPHYGGTNAAWLHPTNGLLMVARLDGPNAQVARGLVDKAMQAEREGLWGRAYFDSRGITAGNYLPGDLWIRTTAQNARRYGFETVHDDEPATFSAGFPMSQIGLYAGWYDGAVSGPFTRAKVEFMPGAIAYHLHSFSARVVRTTTEHWVGPLLDKGAAATMGCVAEPYLEGTPDIAVFFSRLLYLGFSFGEAAYVCQGALSWQTTVIGDPLYRPFGRNPQELHDALMQTENPAAEWSHLRLANLVRQSHESWERAAGYILSQPLTQRSAVLQEKLGDLFAEHEKTEDAIKAYRMVLGQGGAVTPQQRVRVLLTLGSLLEKRDDAGAAYAVYQEFPRMTPVYPEMEAIYQKLAALGDKLGRKEEAEGFRKELERLNARKGQKGGVTAPAK